MKLFVTQLALHITYGGTDMTTTNESSTDNRFYREASAQPNDGGPAFPHPQGWRRDPAISDGMTLRDYFAAKALVGLLAEPFSEGSSATVSHLAPMRPNDEPGDSFARASYLLADAMLKARG